MILYRNKKRGRREKIGGLSVGGSATIKVREMNDPELYPPGHHMQFTFGPKKQFSLELNYHEALELEAKIHAFVRSVEKEYRESLETKGKS